MLKSSMNVKRISFMTHDLNSKNIEKDDVHLNSEDSDYKNLISRLKEIKTTISLLEKTLFR